MLNWTNSLALSALGVGLLVGSNGCSGDVGRRGEDGLASGPGAAGTVLGGTGGSSTAASGGGVNLGSSSGSGGDGMGGAEDCGKVLPLVFRDFRGKTEQGGHPDFEDPSNNGQNEVGCQIVKPLLGADGKPVFQSGIGAQKRTLDGNLFKGCVPWDWTPANVVTSADTFATWYNTTEGTNVEISQDLPLTDGVYDSTAFFPIDGQGFGNTPNQSHNFSFTTEGHVKFTYVKGQTFTFRGDDDLWIFVNKKLALDLGGMHMALEATIDFDKQATALGIVPGQQYQMDIFHAERHTSDSNFRIQTNITCFTPVPIVR